MFDRSYVKRSDQSWKIWLFSVLLLGSGILLFIGFSVGKDQPANFMSLIMSGSCLGALSLIWLSMSIRCKKCRTRLGWRAISKESHNGWLVSLLTRECCPVCKDTRSLD